MELVKYNESGKIGAIYIQLLADSQYLVSWFGYQFTEKIMNVQEYYSLRRSIEQFSDYTLEWIE